MEQSVRHRVDLKLGFACNNRCRFCVQGDKRSRYRNLTTAEAMERLERARSQADEVVLTGGEVTIRRDLVQLVARAKDLGFQTINIQTNGGMHDYLTRAVGSFDQTVAGIRNLVPLGVPVITNTVITRSNFRHLPEIADLLISLGVTQYQFAFVHALGTAARYFSSIVPRMALVGPFVRRGLQLGRQAGILAQTEAIPPCILPGHEEHMAEWILPDATIFDAEMVLDSYRDYRLAEGKAKGPDCSRCAWNPWCEGVWREYVDRYGWAEFAIPHFDRFVWIAFPAQS